MEAALQTFFGGVILALATALVTVAYKNPMFFLDFFFPKLMNLGLLLILFGSGVAIGGVLPESVPPKDVFFAMMGISFTLLFIIMGLAYLAFAIKKHQRENNIPTT